MIAKFTSLILICMAFLYMACEDKTSSAEMETEEPVVLVNPLGEQVFKKTCMICHMENGMGVPGLNPPLSKTEWVNGDKERLIKIVLNGLNEPIEVDGETYHGVMAAHAYLSDEEIAAVLTYVRSSFGNQADPVSTEEVARARANNTTE